VFPANITRAEAAERARHIRTHAYRVDIDVSASAADANGLDPAAVFRSTSTARFETDGTPSWVNLIAHSVIEATLDGVPLPEGCFRDDKVFFEAEPGEHELTVSAWCRYSRTGEGLHRFTDPADHQVYLYTQLETADARRVYACFEQPDLKATFELGVTAPADWVVLSNSPTPTPQPLDDGLARFSFAPTPPVSTYITALVAGPFHTVHDSVVGRAATIPLTLACRQSLADHLDADRLFDITKRGFAVYEKNFGRPYPFTDYVQAFVPEFNAGAMENAGCVTIRDEYLYRSRTTAASYETRDNTILHELAHMWFGDLVTMTWWDDLWLNESFAEWAAHDAQDEIHQLVGTGHDSWATFSNERKTWAYRQDQLPSTHPVAADMVDLEAVELNFDGITYAKGASVLRQLVAYVGRDAFLAGVRAYFDAHAWGNTRLDDLLGVLESTSGRDLSAFSGQWLKSAGVNTLRAEFSVDQMGRFTTFAIRQTALAEWPMLRTHRLGLGFYDDVDGVLTLTHRIEADVDGELTAIDAMAGQRQPALLLLNDGDLTYAKTRLDARSLDTVLRGMPADMLARSLCWGSVWDMCRDGELSASAWVDLVLREAANEPDLTAVGAVLAQSRTAIDLYTPPQFRDELNTRFAQGVAALLKQAEPACDHQLAFLRALIPSLTSPTGVTMLSALLNGQETLPGLVIDADLRWRITTQLARLGVADDDAITAEAARDHTAQGAERAAGARAAMPDAGVKADAWRTVTATPDLVANETHFQICSQFWQVGQEDLLASYLDAYLDVAQTISDGHDGWDLRGPAIRDHVLAVLFPRLLMDRERLDAVHRWFDARTLSDSVTRQLRERIDDAERALRCQGAFSVS